MTAPSLITRTAPVMHMLLDRQAKFQDINDEMLGGLEDAVADFTAGHTLQVLPITAQGRYFCASAALGTDTSPDVTGNTRPAATADPIAGTSGQVPIRLRLAISMLP